MAKKAAVKSTEALQKEADRLAEELRVLRQKIRDRQAEEAKVRQAKIGALVEYVLGPVDTPEKMESLKELLKSSK